MSQYDTVQDVNNGVRLPLDRLILSIAARFGDRSKEVERFLKFAVVGFIGAVVDFGTVIVLQATILPPTDQNGVSLPTNVVIATSLAFLAAVISNFTWNRFWTYPDSRTRSVRRQLAQFTVVSFIGWFGRTLWIRTAYQSLGMAFMPVLLPLIHILRPTYMPSVSANDKLGTIIAQLIGVVVVMFWNYFVNRYWTYNDVKQSLRRKSASRGV